MINYNCDDGDPLSEKFVNGFDRKYFIKLKIIINNTKYIEYLSMKYQKINVGACL